ncbi:preprotein translocase subunit SecG [Candidatus Peregrinibacteria bacterium CG11_big_fil_rev_8_21_14_0_20_46_8]|nr:MAG: preprotein translocase subunit SecG [Candidatus Peregrinibacteria bacterium CG11_big_fil_rev_8_21_14_0_20_46_8]
MQLYLFIAQIIVSVLLITVILAQDKGVGLSSTFGGGGEFYRSKHSADRLLFNATIVLSALFIGIAIAFIFVS